MRNILNQAEFDNVINSGVVLVDFYADWCMPCKMLAPTLQKLEKELAGKVTFVKVDAESVSELSAKYSVSALPTLLVFKGGSLVHTAKGLQKEADIRTILGNLVAAAA